MIFTQKISNVIYNDDWQFTVPQLENVNLDALEFYTGKTCFNMIKDEAMDKFGLPVYSDIVSCILGHMDGAYICRYYHPAIALLKKHYTRVELYTTGLYNIIIFKDRNLEPPYTNIIQQYNSGKSPCNDDEEINLDMFVDYIFEIKNKEHVSPYDMEF